MVATGIIGTALPSIEKALGSGFENSPTQQGVLTVSILVGAMIASAFGGVVANILGRRYATILLGAWLEEDEGGAGEGRRKEEEAG